MCKSNSQISLLKVLESHYTPQTKEGVSRLLPQTNLPLHIPLLSDAPPHSFGSKDPQLLRPPTVLHAAGGFGRRASDGGANLRTYWSREQLVPRQNEQMDELADPYAVVRYSSLIYIYYLFIF